MTGPVFLKPLVYQVADFRPHGILCRNYSISIVKTDDSEDDLQYRD